MECDEKTRKKERELEPSVHVWRGRERERHWTVLVFCVQLCIGVVQLCVQARGEAGDVDFSQGAVPIGTYSGGTTALLYSLTPYPYPGLSPLVIAAGGLDVHGQRKIFLHALPVPPPLPCSFRCGYSTRGLSKTLPRRPATSTETSLANEPRKVPEHMQPMEAGRRPAEMTWSSRVRRATSQIWCSSPDEHIPPFQSILFRVDGETLRSLQTRCSGTLSNNVALCL